MSVVAKCEQCGRIDTRKEWSSPDDAAKQGAFQGWTCPNCAWTEFDLVDAKEAEQPATA